jgi:hypothetical protein
MSPIQSGRQPAVGARRNPQKASPERRGLRRAPPQQGLAAACQPKAGHEGEGSGFWLDALAHAARNPCDQIGHLAQGVVPVRAGPVSGGMLHGTQACRAEPPGA